MFVNSRTSKLPINISLSAAPQIRYVIPLRKFYFPDIIGIKFGGK